MSAINDLLKSGQNSTGAVPSAQLSHPPLKSGPAADFIDTLLKYAQPVTNIGDSVVNAVGDVGNATAQTAQAWARVPSDLAEWAGMKPKTPYVPLTPSAQRGMDTIGALTMAGQPEAGAVEGNAGYILRQGKDEAGKLLNKASAAIEDTASAAKAQPGGLQAGFIKTGVRPIEEGLNPVAEKPTMITKAKADPQAVAKYNLIFDVPRRKVQNMSVHPETVINQLIDDGITNVRSLDDLKGVADNVTGSQGAFPQINNYILSKIEDPVDYTSAIKFKMEEIPKVLEGEKPGFVNEINKEIDQAMKPLSPGDFNSPNYLLPEGTAKASNLFQTSQNLGTIARMYQRKAYTDMGELSHPEFERAAKAILDLKSEIDNAIDIKVTPQDYAMFKQDPFVQQQLQRVPPKVAQRWETGATRFKDGQAIQAPYVNLNHMIEDTKDTQLSVWTKAAKAMQNQSTSGNIANAVTDNLNPKTAVKNVVGGTIKKVLSPFDKSPEDIFAENTAGTSATLAPKAKTGLKKIIAGTAVGGGIALGAETLKNNSNAEGNPNTNNSNNEHISTVPTGPVDVKDLPQVKDIKPDMAIPHPSAVKGTSGSLAISDDQYNNTISELEALKQNPAYQVFPKSEQLQAAIDTVTNKHAQSKPLLDKYEKVTALDQQIQQAEDLLKSTSPSTLNALPFLGGASQTLQENTDPKYKQLMNTFNSIENMYPALKGSLTNSNLVSKDSIKASLAQARKMIIGDYINTLRNFGGGESSTQSTPTSQQFQSPQTNGLAPLGGAPIGGGGTVGGDPNTPLASF